MKIGIVQAKPVAGDIAANIVRHLQLVELAASNGADTVIFPELSLTGYEPTLAGALAMDPGDARLNVFQELANSRRISIGVGAPTAHEAGVRISMIIFRPGQAPRVYSKQHLHPDEEPFFVPGPEDNGLLDDGIALAICYEISVPEHAARAVQNSAAFYVASVAKFANGIEKATARLAEIAHRHSITVLMANCVGTSDGQACAGSSAAWNGHGFPAEQLNDRDEGVIVLDTRTGKAVGQYP